MSRQDRLPNVPPGNIPAAQQTGPAIRNVAVGDQQAREVQNVGRVVPGNGQLPNNNQHPNSNISPSLLYDQKIRQLLSLQLDRNSAKYRIRAAIMNFFDTEDDYKASEIKADLEHIQGNASNAEFLQHHFLVLLRLYLCKNVEAKKNDRYAARNEVKNCYRILQTLKSHLIFRRFTNAEIKRDHQSLITIFNAVTHFELRQMTMKRIHDMQQMKFAEPSSSEIINSGFFVLAMPNYDLSQ